MKKIVKYLVGIIAIALIYLLISNFNLIMFKIAIYQQEIVEKISELIEKENEKIVFVFSATWCPDCIMLDHYLEETINKFPEIKFIYVNRDDYPEIAQALDIFGIPSFVGYKNNVEVSRFVSRLAKTQKEVEEFLEKI